MSRFFLKLFFYFLLTDKKKHNIKFYSICKFMKRFIITQIKSAIGTSPKQKLFLKSLGLKKIGSKVEVEVNSSSESLVKKVAHLVKVEHSA